MKKSIRKKGQFLPDMKSQSFNISVYGRYSNKVP